MSPITTHVLDTAAGKPAAGVPVVFKRRARSEDWEVVASGVTNSDGRLLDWLPKSFKLEAGMYSLTFGTGDYFKKAEQPSFYPEATIVFEIKDAAQHYHVPLLLSPYGYSTYRGS